MDMYFFIFLILICRGHGGWRCCHTYGKVKQLIDMQSITEEWREILTKQTVDKYR